MYKQSMKNLATELRNQGYSYNLIAEKTGVMKSTLHAWLGNVPYVPNDEVIKRIGKARAASGEFKARQKALSLEEAKKMAKKDIGSINNRDLFMLGLGIYIGEGAKSRDIVRIINSDPRVIKLSIEWLRKKCGLPLENFVVRLHVYPDNNCKECINYWSKEIGIPKNQFQKIHIDMRQNKKASKKGKLPYGTAHVTVKSNGKKEFGSFLGRRIMAWIDEVLC